MRTSIRKDYRIAISRQPRAVSRHSQTIVAHAMEQKDYVPIGFHRANLPGAQDRAIRGSYADVAQFSAIARLSEHLPPFFIADWPPSRMQSYPPQTDSTEDRS